MYYYSGAQIEEKKQRRKYSGSVPLTIISDLLNEQKLSFLKIRAFNQLYKPFKKSILTDKLKKHLQSQIMCGNE